MVRKNLWSVVKIKLPKDPKQNISPTYLDERAVGASQGNPLNILPTLSVAKTFFWESLDVQFGSLRPKPAMDNATFISDVTIPDGTVLSPGRTFGKTWRLKNTGTTTWSSGYQLAFVGGDQLPRIPRTAAICACRERFHGYRKTNPNTEDPQMQFVWGRRLMMVHLLHIAHFEDASILIQVPHPDDAFVAFGHYLCALAAPPLIRKDPEVKSHQPGIGSMNNLRIKGCWVSTPMHIVVY